MSFSGERSSRQLRLADRVLDLHTLAHSLSLSKAKFVASSSCGRIECCEKVLLFVSVDFANRQQFAAFIAARQAHFTAALLRELRRVASPVAVGVVLAAH